VQAETIEHVISGCTAIANTDCLRRHDNVAKIIHQHLAEKYKLISDHVPYYKYDPANMIDNNEVKIYWDREICTDVKINANRPDLILYNEEKSEVTITDVVIPLTSDIQKTYTTKISKYNELAQEIKKMWTVK
jgi:lipopolysaccharide export system protein LptC